MQLHLPLRKKIYTLPDENLSLGSIVLWNDSHWIVTEVDKDNDITTQGAIEMCNRQLTWQNVKTGEIHSRWATVQKPYYSNIDENDVISTSSREFKVQMPYDEESSLIDVDKRFMLEIIAENQKLIGVQVSIVQQKGMITKEDFVVFLLSI